MCRVDYFGHAKSAEAESCVFGIVVSSTAIRSFLVLVKLFPLLFFVIARGGVEDTRLEA